MKESDLLKLRPEFILPGGMRMVDWFEITKSESFTSIRSGLRHADGRTKSPYYYEDFVLGKNSKKIALENFNVWWKTKCEK